MNYGNLYTFIAGNLDLNLTFLKRSCQIENKVYRLLFVTVGCVISNIAVGFNMCTIEVHKG